jgi:hypothetical protein
MEHASTPVIDKIRHLFNAGSKVTIEDGKNCYFWNDKWVNGRTIEDIASEVFWLINLGVTSRRIVAEAIPEVN